jgi:hypothetical protein
MGWFGKSNKSSQVCPVDAYVDMMEAGGGVVRATNKEGLPVAVAVPAPAPNSQQAAVLPSPQQPKKASVKQQQHAVQPTAPVMMVVPPPPVFPRVPTVISPCPHCLRTGRTRIRTGPNWLTWILVVVLAFVFWPLCWIPLVTDNMKRTVHFCGHCNQQVGNVRPCQDCCVKHRT